MCGIAGFIERRPNPEALPRMLARLVHRGPDGEGQWRREVGPWHVALGHRRLAIIDVEGSPQPMENEDGALAVTYNGEVYNFQELRPALERAGHRFRTRGDTEVVVHQLEEHGADGVGALHGMFAFALWDGRARRLILARDRAGIKPLYYAQLDGGGLVFASELTSLLAHGGVRAALAPEGLASYFFSDYAHAPGTLLRGVRKLAPGHTVVWEDGRLGEPRAYFRVPAPGPAPARPDAELAASLWSELGRAVKAQLVSDVPVGIFLSGGVDSSCVAALAAAAGGRMKAFCIGFDDATFDESSYARLMAARLDVELVSETLHERNLLDVLDAALDRLDEPMADPSLLPTYLLSRLAARHVKVVVGGDGGDELWGGYPTYRAHGFASLWGHVPEVIRSNVVGRAIGLLPIDDRYQSLEWKLRRFTERWARDPVTRHLRWMSSVDLPELSRALPSAGGARPATLDARLPETDDRLHRLLALDFTTYMPGSVLAKVDRASMAHGLEVRPPLLDDALVDLAFALPSTYKVRGGATKALLKRAARGHIPDEIIDRPKKGFGVPLAAWLRGPLRARVEDIAARSPLWDTGLLDRAVFAGWTREHLDKRRDHAKALWALLVLDHWYRRHLAPPAPRRVPLPT
ncbi:MAG TPA: asparagine synthase (glutamine-hydrolyzing) [Polyangia bacterium]|nr:asparagine synthase (glutamine-hydrolyzing) [Polyangia bacterium]